MMDPNQQLQSLMYKQFLCEFKMTERENSAKQSLNNNKNSTNTYSAMNSSDINLEPHQVFGLDDYTSDTNTSQHGE